jgi:hypothetical protein
MSAVGMSHDSRRHGMTASKATAIVVACVLFMLSLLAALPN